MPHRLTATRYERIEQLLAHPSPGEDERVTIALDDRIPPETDRDGDDQDGENTTRNGWGA